jgi:hypothetical protein
LCNDDEKKGLTSSTSAEEVPDALRRAGVPQRAPFDEPDVRRRQAAPPDAQGRPESDAAALCVRSGQPALVECLRQGVSGGKQFLSLSLTQAESSFPASPEPTQVKHLSGAPPKGRPLDLPTNISLGLRGTNTLSYYKNL